MEKTPDKRACRYVETPIGPLTLVADGEALVEARFGGFPIFHESPVLDMAERELKEYFSRQRFAFDAPLAPQGTPFQLRVWEEVRRIPYGETRAYIDLSLIHIYTLEVQVEMTEDMVSDTVSHIQGLARTIHERIKSVVGISTDVKLVAPKSIPRSEGKAKRVIDKRKL